ncbi:MAG: beta-galactosidase trimerization domain-containing protein [Trueperaceae bacterium]
MSRVKKAVSRKRATHVVESTDLPLRHLHLDFHTSEKIGGVGKNFSASKFAKTLRQAEIASVNLFARCWHGWMYYDTPRFPERKHPHLKRDLLREQLEACQAEGIKTIVYLAVQPDYYTAMHTPEWLSQTPEGCIGNGYTKGEGLYEPGFRRALCFNSPFGDFMKAQVEEVLELFSPDGFWFDGVMPLDDSSRWSREGMRALGLNPQDKEQRIAYGQKVYEDFKLELSNLIRRHAPHAGIFYNRGHIDPSIRASLKAYTHLEVESLPGDAWGYDHFPITGRYVRTLGKPWLGMTARFHTGWADLHSFKTEAALTFECLQMLALGGGCSIGDQLDPSGKPCETTYNLIGNVYKEVKALEPWCQEAKPVTEIAVFLSEHSHDSLLPVSAVGALKMLQAASHQFDFVDAAADLSDYKVVILPDDITVDNKLQKKLESFLAKGGSIIASYKAGLNAEGKFPALFGVTSKGDAEFVPDFIRCAKDFETSMPSTEHVMYLQGLDVSASKSATVLARTVHPYFNRSYEHFHSHRHAPSSGKPGAPAIVQQGRVIYFAHPIFTQYAENSPPPCQALLLAAIKRLLPKPLLTHDAPTTLQAHLTSLQKDKQQSLVLHLLHYVPQKKSRTLELIDTVIPLFNVGVTLREDKKVKAVRVVPEGRELPFRQEKKSVSFVVPEVQGHAHLEVVLDY